MSFSEISKEYSCRFRHSFIYKIVVEEVSLTLCLRILTL